MNGKDAAGEADVSYRQLDSGCWEATRGEVLPGGYIRIQRNHRRLLAHRYVLEVFLGRPLVGWALHHCDNPPCVNPDHLYEGTPADNCRDRDNRGRAAVGSRSGSTKMTPMSVTMMRHDRIGTGLSYRKLAAKYGITHQAVRSICIGDSWKVLE